MFNCIERKVDTEFIIDEEARVVVCIITAENDVESRLSKYELWDDAYDNVIFDTRRYKGVARCAPDDVWDEKIGMHLAEYRASKKRQNDVNNELRKYINGVKACVDKLEKYGLMKEPRKPKELYND